MDNTTENEPTAARSAAGRTKATRVTAKAPAKSARKAAASKSTAKAASRMPTTAKPAAASVVAPVVASVNLSVVPAKAMPTDTATRASETDGTGAVLLRKKDFVERVVAASGAKKKDARDVIDATLKALGEALAAGESVVLPPFGRARVSRQVDRKGGEMLVVKLVRSDQGSANKPVETSDEALAVGED